MWNRQTRPPSFRCLGCGRFPGLCLCCTACREFPCDCDRCEDCGRNPCNCGEYYYCDDCDSYPCRCNDTQGGEYCDDCDSYSCRCNDTQSGAYVRGYSYKPRPVFYGNGPLYLGMELEIETRAKAPVLAVAGNAFGDLAYYKEDGSLSDRGFEIVTHPMSHEYAMDSFPWQALPEMRRAGAFIRDRYENGLHVHVSRAGFTDAAHTFKWMKLWYRNERQMTALARRDSDSWASFSNDVRKAQKHLVKHKGGYWDRDQSYDYGRYNAINTCPTDTFEVRVFASSLRPNEVQGALSLCASTVEYTRGLTAQEIIKQDAWSWDRYVSWLRGSDGKPYKAALSEVERLCVC